MPAVHPVQQTGEEDVGVVVVAHGTEAPADLLKSLTYDQVTDSEMPEVDTKDFKALVLEAASVIKDRILRGERVHVVCSGGKRKWTDMLSLGDVLTREIVRKVGLEKFVPSPGATATLHVESASKNIYDAAKMSVNVLKKFPLESVLVVANESVAQHCQDAFDLTLPRCRVRICCGGAPPPEDDVKGKGKGAACSSAVLPTSD
mmetsp:Transcript_21494/g.66283  ORF Transcript_21494/g.66283 Transcript_21494/m.66283 type:complete len:203 (-) Transcript_21494:60-668(-)